MSNTLINEQRRESFRPEVRASVPDSKALGVMIARYFKWDGVAILETAVAALEDANFSAEAARVREVLS